MLNYTFEEIHHVLILFHNELLKNFDVFFKSRTIIRCISKNLLIVS